MGGDNRSRGGLTHHLGGPGGGDSGSALTCSGFFFSLKHGGSHRLFLLFLLFLASFNLIGIVSMLLKLKHMSVATGFSCAALSQYRLVNFAPVAMRIAADD